MLSAVSRLTRETYDTFVQGNEAVVVLFDAPAWDTGGWCIMEPLFSRAAEQLNGIAALGFVDVDGPAEAEVCRSIPIANVPTIAYYLDGRLVAALIGIGQDVVERTRAMMAGDPIGYRDGRMLPDAVMVSLRRR